MDELLITADFREEATLADGTQVLLRLLRAGDAPLLVEGFANLSPESRYRRFLSARTELTEDDLRYLTEPDGEQHLALGAVGSLDGKGLGVARFVRLAGEPTVAEVAITVVDAAQGKGLGRLLLLRLVAAARERGVRSFRCEVLAGNDPMRQLLATLATSVRSTQEENVVHVEVSLDDIEGAEPPLRKEHPLYRLFIIAAAGGILVRTATRRLLGAKDED